MHHTDPSKLSIGKALGRVPSGLFVLTSKYNDKASAMLASWVQQAAFEPPAVSVAVARQRWISDLIRRSGRMALSIIPKDDTALMKHYARGLSETDDPFDGVRTMDAPSGVPVLADAVAFLDCRLVQTVDFGADHEMFLAEITAGDVLREGQAFTHQRGNGFHY